MYTPYSHTTQIHHTYTHTCTHHTHKYTFTHRQHDLLQTHTHSVKITVYLIESLITLFIVSCSSYYLVFVTSSSSWWFVVVFRGEKEYVTSQIWISIPHMMLLHTSVIRRIFVVFRPEKKIQHSFHCFFGSIFDELLSLQKMQTPLLRLWGLIWGTPAKKEGRENITVLSVRTWER